MFAMLSRTVKTVDCKVGIYSKKRKICFFDWERDGNCFWDSPGVILIDFRQKGKTIAGEYYVSLPDKMKAEISDKLPHLQKKKILFHQDNAPSHTSRVAMAKVHELRVELLDHQPYLPDLAPSNFFLFL